MRIAIVNDVLVAREALRRVVLSSPEHEVVWTARDGAEAIAWAREDRPDLILMDLIMPGTNGVEATHRIMSESPCAILVVTSSVSGHLCEVYEAMGHGAIDAIDTPSFSLPSQSATRAPILDKIDLIGRLVGYPADRPKNGEGAAMTAQPAARVSHHESALEPLIVVGASTGGPQALVEILSGLPPNLEAGIILVQHIDSGFAEGLGQWLSDQTHRRVTLIGEGHTPVAGEVLLARTDDHLVLNEDHRLHYSIEPRMNGCRPSIDVFFASMAQNWSRPGVAVLLTGVGRDGANGLLQLRNLGWRTIAQDELSCVVKDMPRSAVENGAAQEVVPLTQIAEAIVKHIPNQTRS